MTSDRNPENAGCLTFAERLAVAIKEMELTQEAAAAACDVSQSAISTWLRGERFPSAKRLKVIAENLRIPYAEIEHYATQNFLSHVIS